MKPKFRIFIAGSTSLAPQMELFRNVANKLSVEYDRRGIDIVFLAVTCTDFDMFHHEDGQQSVYDSFIREQADIVYFIFDSISKPKTEAEYILATKSFIMTAHPEIQVFIRQNESREMVVRRLSFLRSQIRDLPEQYFTIYNDDKDLTAEIEHSLRNFANDQLGKQQALISNDDKEDNISMDEACGQLLMAQNLKEEGGRSNTIKAHDILKRLVSLNFDNWRFYFQIARMCSSKTDEEQLGICLNAYSQATMCNYTEHWRYMECRANVYAGVMHRRLGNLVEALRYVNKADDMVVSLRDIDRNVRAEYSDVLYNLYVIYSVLGEKEESSLIKQRMREELGIDTTEDLISQANGAINRSKEAIAKKEMIIHDAD